jgi:tRNA dimethylallyltransferase
MERLAGRLVYKGAPARATPFGPPLFAAVMEPPLSRPIRAVLIAGPTASGKSTLALALARRIAGMVINADASQVYGDLRILTARPGAGEERMAPHALYGHVDAAEPYAVGRWLADVDRVINRLSTDVEPTHQQTRDALSAVGVPIFVGGTGLYFDALTRGLASVPAIPDAVRSKWRGFGSAEDLHRELTGRDPAMAARLRPSDPQRLMRALEVIDATGRSLADWQADASDPLIDLEGALRVVLSPDRPALDARIARRLDAMVAQGALGEAARLAARGLHPSLPAMKALGVQPFAAVARGETALDAALERVRLDTRRYAKRQSTWFRNRMPDWLHVAPDAAWGAALAAIEERGIAPR